MAHGGTSRQEALPVFRFAPLRTDAIMCSGILSVGARGEGRACDLRAGRTACADRSGADAGSGLRETLNSLTLPLQGFALAGRDMLVLGTQAG